MIEDILRRAQIPPPPYTAAQASGDHARLMRRIREVQQQRAAAPWLDITHWLAPTSSELAALILQAAGDAAARDELMDRIEHDLMALALAVIRLPGAAERLVTFIDQSADDPFGACVFACLLYRKIELDSARFWWRFAAGAGDATAAYCLFLEALLRGQLDEAVHCYHTYNAGDFLTDLHTDHDQQTPTRRSTPQTALPDVSSIDTGTNDGRVTVPAAYLADLPHTDRARLCPAS